MLVLGSFLAGFAVGRRLGLSQGFKAGTAYGFLDARRQSLENGRCPICSSHCLVSTGAGEKLASGPPGPEGCSPGQLIRENDPREAEGSEFGAKVAGCRRQVLNLLMGVLFFYRMMRDYCVRRREGGSPCLPHLR